MRRRLLLLPYILFCCSCKKNSSTQAAAQSEPVSVTTLQDARLTETSGIAASVANPGLLYVHNDSGDTSRFFAIHPDGSLKAVVYYNGDKSLKLLGVTDCEDIAVNIVGTKSFLRGIPVCLRCGVEAFLLCGVRSSSDAS